ncbi:GlcNAc transferase [Cavenderia fasciculata]|uniref:alpha-1,3-mannosyl-glycoprotein 2-beta-N-acetylglucosaminyltransferase n=1 Tax=Cavenderia fasciculata TaxID=261658 RepID=F4PP27_CACFS|nr:GlcNAc transferase [Cavenderia fasciculata]EGG22140.1 GlcNAc transferase [Cavenderia fasciculata]|eukprot:XP_004359991.1 GlcNAc transferase [Cavenderia fasciculata]
MKEYKKNHQTNNNKRGNNYIFSNWKDHHFFFLFIALFIAGNVVYYFYYQYDTPYTRSKKAYVPAGYENDDFFADQIKQEQEQQLETAAGEKKSVRDSKKVFQQQQLGHFRRKQPSTTAEQSLPLDHPLLVIVTTNKPQHLDRLLQNLLDNVIGLDKSRIAIFNDGHISIDPILKKHSIVNHQLAVELNAQHHPSTTPTKESQQTNISHQQKITNQNKHYKQIFDTVFNSHKSAIFLEDDLLLSPDFLLYMNKMLTYLDQDNSLFCVSSWNDNAFRWASYPPSLFQVGAKDQHGNDITPADLIANNNNNNQNTKNQDLLLLSKPKNLYSFKRQQHFGGLGWMTTSDIYQSNILPNWTDDQLPWDVIVQNSLDPNHHECIFPEISRSYHAPNIKINFINSDKIEIDEWSFLQFSKDNDNQQREEYENLNLDYLIQSNYEVWMNKVVENTLFVESLEMITLLESNREDVKGWAYLVESVESNQDPRWDHLISTQFGMIGRGNGGTVRGIHRGIVQLCWFGKPLYLIGAYSPYLNKDLLDSHTLLIKDIDTSIVEFDKSINNLQSLVNLFKLKNDASVIAQAAKASLSCHTACQQVGKICHESDQVLLVDVDTTKYIFETLCDKVTVLQDYSGQLPHNNFNYLPIRHQNFSCVIPPTFKYLSCNATPPSGGTSRLCVCRDLYLS